jgi:putative phosphoesterase
MLVGVISDSHDHLPNLRQALTILAQRRVPVVFHCGDLIAPFVTRELGQFPGAVHTVFGNNDADRFLALKVQQTAAPNVTHHGEFGFVAVESHRIGLTHYGEYARGFVAAKQCDAAFYGHTHEFKEERIGGGLVLNPGELLGMKGRPSFCIYNTELQSFERISFDHQPW